jgi:small-conductance mechanosensitive channel
MHMQDGPQLDLSAQVAIVKAKTRPWKAIIALILAIAAAVASGWAHGSFPRFFFSHQIPSQIIAALTALAFLVFASIATLDLSSKARKVLDPVTGPSHSAIVSYAVLLVGALTTLIVTLGLFGVPIGQLVLGGALTSVFVGIAAQQSLSNVFAGIVLLLAHPFRVGDSIRLQAGALGGPIDGTVAEIGITYVQLATSIGLRSVPNSQVLNAVVGPLPPPDPEPTAQPLVLYSAQPAGTQPAGTQPAGTQPAGTQPAGTQPAGTQPADDQPSAGLAAALGATPSGAPPGAPS